MLSQHYERNLINKPHTQSESPNIAIGPNADIGLDLSGSSKPKTPSVSGKGKREARRTTVSKDFSSNTPQTAFSQAQEGFRVLPRSCAQSTRDGKPIKGRDGGSKPRTAAEDQLSSLPWPEMGFKFGGSSSGSSRGGISRVSSKPTTSDEVVQREILESMDECVSFDRGECEGGQSTFVGFGMVRGVEPRVVFSDKCTIADEGSRTGLGVVAPGIADTNLVQSEPVGVSERRMLVKDLMPTSLMGNKLITKFNQVF